MVAKGVSVGFIVCVVLYIFLFILFLASSGCSLLQGDVSKNTDYKILYEGSQIQLASTQNMLIKSETALSEMRESEKTLRNSLDSLFKYTDEKTDSLYSVISIKDILIRSNDANIDTMLWYINEGVINYINKLRAKYGLEGL